MVVLADEAPLQLTVRFPGVSIDSGSHFYVTAFILCSLKYLCTKNEEVSFPEIKGMCRFPTDYTP